jgi:RNA polymerase sigma factor (sigma-70 family)
MQELDDSALLREYTERSSEEAFATLVTRHVNKVYSVALRHTGNSHRAEEITQAVFVILARKSPQLGKRVVLSGWLYETARLTAVTFLRSEIRRALREHESFMQTLPSENEPDAWTKIAPLLDSAMAGLSEADRHAIVLRFFDGKSFKEVAVALGAGEEAVKKRVSRAVEKLRSYFAKRGVVVPVAALTVMLAADSTQAAPAGLAKTAVLVATAKGVATSSSTLTLIKGALKVMAWTKAKTAVAVGLGLILATGTATVAFQKIAAKHFDEGWRTKSIGPSEVDNLPARVGILPSKYPPPFFYVESGSGFEKCVGAGVSVRDIAARAYRVPSGRVHMIGTGKEAWIRRSAGKQ